MAAPAFSHSLQLKEKFKIAVLFSGNIKTFKKGTLIYKPGLTKHAA